MDALLGPAARPRYCPDQPIMWREPGTVQFGTDDDRVIVTNLTAADVRWLTQLDGMQTWAHCPEPTDAQRRLLGAALAAGAIEDATQIAPSWRLLTTAERRRYLSSCVAGRLTYRDIRRTLIAIERRLTLRVRLTGAGPLHRACDALLSSAGIARADHSADITIIAGGCHPDAMFQHPELHDTQIASTPHLVVSAYGDSGTVGPLVIPGVTSCLMCDQLHRRDRDVAWPVLVSQRSALATPNRPWPIDTAHAQALAAHAIMLVHTWRENPQEPERWANVARTIQLPMGTVVDDPRPMHPMCGCSWSPMSEEPADT
jgi:hypothetical protein